MVVRKRHGFIGEHHVVVPSSVVRNASRHPLLRPLMPTAAGYFPHAEGHYVVRPEGVGETIVILCWSGRGWYKLGGRRQSVDAGETVFIPKHAAHAYGADDKDPWSIVWAHATGREVPAFLEQLSISLRSPKLRLAADSAVQPHFSSVWQILEQGYSLPCLLAASSSLRLVLSEMVRLRLEKRSPKAPDEDLVERATAWMRDNLAQRASLTDMARHVGASVSHLSSLFKKKMGYAPMDYFTRLKVQRACQLLDTTSARVKEVGARVGFDDQYYFSRLFHQIMGMSPKAYRTLVKG